MRIKLRKNKSTLDTEQIPLEIQSLEIIGDSLERLPRLSNYHELKSLYIHCPQVSSFTDFPPKLCSLKVRQGNISKKCLTSISELYKLERLFLIETKIEKLPDTFFLKLDKVTDIDFKNNFLEELPQSITKLKRLSRINIDQNKFTKFPQALYEMPQINHISADHNSFDEEEIATIYRKLGLWL